MEVSITYNDKSQIKGLLNKIEDRDDKSLSFIFIDSIKDKKKAWSLKSHWGAKLDPFIIIMDEDKPIKAFYSEAENSINNLILYLNL